MHIPIGEKLAAIGSQLTFGNMEEQFWKYRNGQNRITWLFKGNEQFPDSDDRVELTMISKGGMDPCYHREQDKFMWFLNFSDSPLIHLGELKKDGLCESAHMKALDAIPNNLYEIKKGTVYGSSPKKDGFVYLLVGDHIGRHHRERSVSYSEDIIFVRKCIYV